MLIRNNFFMHLIFMVNVNVAFQSHDNSTFTVNGNLKLSNVQQKGTVKFKVAGVWGGGKPIKVEASALPKFTDYTYLPTMPVFPVTLWKHLSDIELADPDCRVPAGLNMLLGGKSSVRQSSMASVIVSLEHLQCSNHVSTGYWMVRWMVKLDNSSLIFVALPLPLPRGSTKDR